MFLAKPRHHTADCFAISVTNDRADLYTRRRRVSLADHGEEEALYFTRTDENRRACVQVRNADGARERDVGPEITQDR